ncbi:MAG TPA: phytanoyl-CoA dioxygenase family protein [Novosphingobium sp.]|nr:phytanoyl-CoA dioxygenase family protein [Novosphingobium sp.]
MSSVSDLPAYFSMFGGMWIDRPDWRQMAVAHGLSDEMIAMLARFIEDGYIVIEGAADTDVIDAFQAQIETSFRQGNPALLYQSHASHETMPLDGPVDRLGTRVVDCFVALPDALKLFTSPRLIEFLTVVLGEKPLLFQSLSFDQGSQQGLHQDTAYVVVDRPMELVACWIALEDVKEGSGELMYVPGSHRLSELPFGGDRKHWDASVDGREPHEEWARRLREQATSGPRGVERFLARKGDILIWHADLAHGGAPVADPALTRQSLVGHFCPVSARPRYFDFGPCRTTTHDYGPLAYASSHYDLSTIAPISKEG